MEKNSNFKRQWKKPHQLKHIRQHNDKNKTRRKTMDHKKQQHWKLTIEQPDTH